MPRRAEGACEHRRERTSECVSAGAEQATHGSSGRRAAPPASLPAVLDGFSALLIVVVILAVAFDYINGFHDTANAIATSVSTRALRPTHAILMSATANFVGALTGTAVAKTIASGIATTPTGDAGQTIVAAALLGAIFWNLLTWRLGIPSSSSHALIGGLIGAVVAASGTGALNGQGIFDKVLFPLVASPILGVVIGFSLMVVLLNVFRRAHPKRINDRFRRLQLLSAAYMAFSHGSNDAQKTMGIITLALVAGGVLPEPVVPLWVILIAASAISLGTAAGGWRIIKTMGQRVVKLDPVHGFAAETTAATIIIGASHFGMPVSTTHVIASAIMGVGASDRFSAVRWGVAGNIITAWVLTIPASGAVAWLSWEILSRVL
jgi:inorganic phosphate transporter, PiT family